MAVLRSAVRRRRSASRATRAAGTSRSGRAGSRPRSGPARSAASAPSCVSPPGCGPVTVSFASSPFWNGRRRRSRRSRLARAPSPDRSRRACRSRWRFFWRMCSRTSCPQNCPHCGQRSHSTAHRFFTSLVHASVPAEARRASARGSARPARSRGSPARAAASSSSRRSRAGTARPPTSMPRRKSAGATTSRLEVLLDRRRAAHHLGLAREDARERLRVERPCRSARRRRRRSSAAELSSTPPPRPTVVTVMPSAAIAWTRSRMPFCGACPSVSRMTCFLFARVVDERLVGRVERREDLRAAARLDARDVALDARAVLARRVIFTMRVGCESNAMTSSRSSADERVGRRLRGRFGHLERQPAHRSRAIDDERHRDLRLVAPLLGVHPHRQDPLDRRVVPAAEAVAVLAAGEEEAAAEVAHVLLDRRLAA